MILQNQVPRLDTKMDCLLMLWKLSELNRPPNDHSAGFLGSVINRVEVARQQVHSSIPIVNAND
eukprot:615945-Prorocentrum_lima.AAC.1